MQINIDIDKYQVKVSVTPDEVRWLVKDERIYNLFLTVFDITHDILEIISEKRCDKAVIEEIQDLVVDNR